MELVREYTLEYLEALPAKGIGLSEFEYECLLLSPKAARVTFDCPQCGGKNVTVWLYPDTPLLIECSHCGAVLKLIPPALR